MLQIGFDIGGTNIKAGVVDDKRKLIIQRREPFPTGEPYEKVVDIMEALILDMTKGLSVHPKSFDSIGIAVPGSIDSQGETVLNAYNLHFHQVPLKKALEERFPVTPVYLANDADAAALAELYAGALKGCKTAVLMTLGTGVGGGVILNGHLFGGGLGHGVELGHMTLVQDGDVCSCGKRGCMETVCAATWLVKQGREAVISHPLSLIYKKAGGKLDRVTAKLVVDSAKDGDAVAVHIFSRYIDYLSSAIISVVSLLDPEVIALGGGVSLAGNFLYKPLREQVRLKSFFKVPHKVVPAQLGNNAGIIGAAMLALDKRAADR